MIKLLKIGAIIIIGGALIPFVTILDMIVNRSSILDSLALTIEELKIIIQEVKRDG